MKNPLKIILFGLIALTVLVIGGLLALQSTSSAFAQSIATLTPIAPAGDVASPAPTASTAQTSSVVELWDKFCVSKVPYTLLAIPQDATFSVTQPQGPLPTPVPGYTMADQTACDSVGVFRGKQVIVCRGPQLFSFSLQVSSAGATTDYQVPLKACALPHITTPAATPAP
jgi:hypothetical protein